MSIENSEKMLDGSPSAKEAEKARRDLLLKVYDAALAEYRFNIQLNWDRVKFYLGLAVSGIAAGTALFRIYTDNWVASILLAVYFFILAAVTYFGSQSIYKGKEYSRQAVLTKTLVERELRLFQQIEGLNDPDLHLGITVTPGQKNYLGVIFNRKERLAKQPDAGSIIQRIQWIFLAIIAVQILFGIFAWFSTVAAIDKPTDSKITSKK